MNITIIAALDTNTTYDEWVESLQSSVDMSLVSKIAIPMGCNILFDYVRRYAKANSIGVVILCLRTHGRGENTKLLIPQFVSESELLLAFRGNTVFRYNEITEEVWKEVSEIILSNPSMVCEMAEEGLPPVTNDELISAQEEALLVKQIQQGGADSEAAMTRLLFCVRRFVYAIAKQYMGRGLSLQQLIEEGNIGVIAATKRYDASRGFKFITYAVWWIRTSIENALKETN